VCLPPSAIVRRRVTAEELWTTERPDTFENSDSLIRHFQTLEAGGTLQPIVVLPVAWTVDTMRQEVESLRGRGPLHTAVMLRLEAAIVRLGHAAYCLLDGNHRALAAALRGTDLAAFVIATPAALDELRQLQTDFPHPEGALEDLVWSWIEHAYGTMHHAPVAREPVTVAERARALEENGLLPDLEA